MKKFYWILSVLCGFTFIACSESKEVSEFEGNWEERNMAYIDSIANVARKNLGDDVGQWKVLKSYKLPSDGSILGATDNQQYVYAKIKKVGEGTVSPIFSDSISVNYSGRLIPTTSYPKGYAFDQNTRLDINEENIALMQPIHFITGDLIAGWTTALQQMHKGDIWQLFIPQKLGYRGEAQTGIPAYSTLVFDVALIDFGF